MINKILTKLIGSKNERELKRIKPLVERINSLEGSLKKFSDEELRNKTKEFKERLRQGETLDDILVEAFAVVREAASRTINMRHFDVQLIGGIVLHQGKIAEMATGEGKTLVATLAAYLNALTGEGVHIVTVNDYLAKRDRNWMGPVYEFLGLTVGVLQHDMPDEERKKEYLADITYGTNSEFGFDYLRDNMKYRLEDCVQRGHNYAIVDEVDSILIDEARTPLIISGPSEESTQKYYTIDRAVRRLKKGMDYEVDEKTKTVTLTDVGIEKLEKMLQIKNLYDPKYMEILHMINQACKAHNLFKRDVDYIVKDGKVILVDEFTGRLMPGRRYSESLHQALEAKEGVKIEAENQTLASITIQNYFRMYKKLAGMTGTAETEALEFKKIYNLDVVVIPTNKPLIRYTYPDVIYKTEAEKFKAVVKEIEELYKTGRPVLVGTISIDKSERLSNLLKIKGIPHVVLNAKHHEKEAEIVAKAGKKYAVTISTNMAGRGTDIVLEEGVAELGGLHVIGTERHEARRIDNQLRGRAGRQGDPGSSRFYLSLEDDLMRVFGSERISKIMDRLHIPEDTPIEHKIISKAIENAQKQVEAHNFSIRKHLLEYDDVMNKQREAIYSLRQQILKNQDQYEYIMELAKDILNWIIETRCPKNKDSKDWEFQQLKNDLIGQFGLNVSLTELENFNDNLKLEDYLWNKIENKYKEKEERLKNYNWHFQQQMLMLSIIDSHWKDHLLNLDHLREGIGLRGYGQRDPLVEYKKESHMLFEEMVNRIEEDIVKYIFILEPVEREERKYAEVSVMDYSYEKAAAPNEASVKAKTIRHQKIGRNEPCPCGSGKKYKKCHGA